MQMNTYPPAQGAIPGTIPGATPSAYPGATPSAYPGVPVQNMSGADMEYLRKYTNGPFRYNPSPKNNMINNGICAVLAAIVALTLVSIAFTKEEWKVTAVPEEDFQNLGPSCKFTSVALTSVDEEVQLSSCNSSCDTDPSNPECYTRQTSRQESYSCTSGNKRSTCYRTVSTCFGVKCVDTYTFSFVNTKENISPKTYVDTLNVEKLTRDAKCAVSTIPKPSTRAAGLIDQSQPCWKKIQDITESEAKMYKCVNDLCYTFSDPMATVADAKNNAFWGRLLMCIFAAIAGLFLTISIVNFKGDPIVWLFGVSFGVGPFVPPTSATKV
jgi:hypothetical protein